MTEAGGDTALVPVARPGLRHADPVAAAGARPLAGSRHVMFDRLTDGAGGTVAPEAVPELSARLSEPRPDLCGMTLDEPRIMGILNVTPDSFSDGGRLEGIAGAVAHAQALSEASDILDIGGESTRPGAEEVPVVEEIARVVPAIMAIRAAGITTPISIDTRKAAVAAAALDAGADMVNDVAAGRFDAEMLPLVAERGVPICLMHSVADPATMQAAAHYADVAAEVQDHLAGRIAAALEAGIARERLIADPGIGFGKTLQHNLSLVRGLARYHALGVPLLFGASRKRFIGTIGGVAAADERIGGSVAVALLAADRGAHILRVHDAHQTRQALRLHLAVHEGFEG